MPSNRVRLYQHFLEQGKRGSTDEEAEDALDLPHQTVSAVRGELVKMGAVVDTEVCRWTRSNRKATVRVGVPDVDVSRRPPATPVEEKLRWIRAAIRDVEEGVLDTLIATLREALVPPDHVEEVTVMDFFGAGADEIRGYEKDDYLLINKMGAVVAVSGNEDFSQPQPPSGPYVAVKVVGEVEYE